MHLLGERRWRLGGGRRRLRVVAAYRQRAFAVIAIADDGVGMRLASLLAALVALLADGLPDLRCRHRARGGPEVALLRTGSAGAATGGRRGGGQRGEHHERARHPGRVSRRAVCAATPATARVASEDPQALFVGLLAADWWDGARVACGSAPVKGGLRLALRATADAASLTGASPSADGRIGRVRAPRRLAAGQLLVGRLPALTGLGVEGVCCCTGAKRTCSRTRRVALAVLGPRRGPRGRNAREIAGISGIRQLTELSLILAFCRFVSVVTLDRACLKIVVSPVRVRVSPSDGSPVVAGLPCVLRTIHRRVGVRGASRRYPARTSRCSRRGGRT